MKETINQPLESTENKVLIEFAKLMGVTPTQIKAKNKIRHMSDIRHLYCKLRYEMHSVTYSATGREIDRHAATVRYGVMRINNMLLLNDSKTVAMWNRIKDIPGFYYEPPTSAAV